MIVNNEEFNKAIDNADNQKIILTVQKKFRKFIPYTELRQCGNIALWKTIQKYNPEKKNKFTSFLYKMTNWECIKWIKNDRKEREKSQRKKCMVVEGSYNDELLFDLRDLLDVLPPLLNKITTERILYKMTYKEIGRENNLSTENIRKKLEKAYKILEDVYRTSIN